MQTDINTQETIDVSDDLKEARRRLERWGDWLRAVAMRDIGYPKHAAFTVEPSGEMVDYDDPEAEQIEVILTEMLASARRADQCKVLMQEYYYKSTVRTGCARMRMTRTQYCDERSRGENYVAGILIGMQKLQKIINNGP